VHTQGEELDDDIRVHRINRWYERPARKKALSYALGLIRMWWLLITRYRRHEVLFVSVPPMGYLLNLILPHRFSMVIWDIYPDTLKITGMRESNPVYRIWAWLNRHSFRNAFRLYTISEVMADTLSKYIERDRLIIQPIWSIFQGDERIPKERNRFISQHDLSNLFIVQYSGNIGLTHNVELLIDIAERLQDRADILFQIIGRGPREPHIRRLVNERRLSNVQMLPFQSDEIFPHSLSAADLGVVILSSQVSQGSVPSKAFNLMSFGVPSLYVSTSDSQLARYAQEYGHARCMAHNQLEEIADFITELASRLDLRQAMSERALIAAKDFRRENADRFAAAYFQESVEAT
jgi:glycosyltransferase involved in cell wall biosynthesis